MNTANLPLKPPQHLLLHSRYPFQIRHFRFYRRRRIKRTACISSNNLLEPFRYFLSQFPSQNSLDFLAPILGLASGLTLYLSQSKSTNPNSNSLINSNIGEWILFASPTPFNRFVFLRCPSISLEGLENVSERFLEEDRHFVRLSRGRIEARESGIGGIIEEKLEYQRVCVSTEDGGVISLDWPANLELREEHGLDTTLLLVPGTTEGSMCENVRDFVCDALMRGFFPVVLNPRGCARSPLTTARLFTAADSDDICTAIHFINKARPWTTLMGVGWGYGANMLTKYLAEVGDRTPLTAATCINNPFDLEEVTKSSPYHIALDQKLTGGLIDILQSNKELFQGREKGFDVEKALSAKSVRDFEKAISMISYGFEEIEDFYSKSSTRDVVGNVKIPVLFLQNDDGTVPLFSMPRSLIAENPFTSLLLCSCVPSSVIASDRAAVSWCQNLTTEWLSAVELGLLKGRHPLLKDVDLSLNPKKGLTLVKGRTTSKRSKSDKFLDLSLTDANGYTMDPIKEVLEDSDTAVQSRYQQDSHKILKLEEGLQEGENDALQQTSSVDVELVKEEVADTGSGEVIQTAQVVMNMLDVTMPGILEEEEKKKVLTAVGQGETLMKALQDAVPEDVREKLRTSVSGILHAQNTNLKLDRFLGIGKIPAATPGVKSKIQEKSRASDAEATSKDPRSSDEIKKVDDLTDGSDNNQPGSEKSVKGLDSELCSSENVHKSSDLGQPQTTNSQQGDAYGSGSKGTSDSGNSHRSDEFTKERADLVSDSGEKGFEISAMPNVTSCTEKVNGSEEAIIDQDGGTPQLEIKRESNTQKSEERVLNSSGDQSKMVSSNIAEAVPSSAESFTDSQPMEREGNDNHKMEIKAVPSVPDQNKPIASDSNPPAFGVAEALDALTGMDDSTQVAVNSVFGVIEDMISQLEEGKDDENNTQDTDNFEDESIETTYKKEHASGDHILEVTGTNDVGMQSDVSNDSPVRSTSSKYKFNEEIKKNKLVGGKFLADYADRHVNSIPLYVSAHPYRDYLQNEYFHRYLLSKAPNSKPLDLDTTTSLLFDYFPEDGQWKLLEQPGIIEHDLTADDGVDRKDQIHPSAEVNDADNYIEPSYVLLDTEKQQEPVREYSTVDNLQEHVENGKDRLEEVMQFVKIIILDALRVEIDRKLSADDMKEMESDLARDLELVANAVSLAIGHDTGNLSVQDNSSIQSTPEKVGTLQGEEIVRAISSAVPSTNYLGRVLPVGVVIGSSLAALRKYFDVGTRHDIVLTSNEQTEISGRKDPDNTNVKNDGLKLTIRSNQTTSMRNSRSRELEEAALKNKNSDNVMVGAVTAAIGASALLVQQQDTAESLSNSFKEKASLTKEVDKVDEEMSEKNQNIAASLAEKAMSVAGPVVPTKEDGEVDQERLVAMLADLGQKGGLLRLVGKLALLWGGIRGAMSLTNKLISFLHMAERPLYQRIIGFAGMVLVLWSPVIIPLLPTLVQSWTTSKPSRFAELGSIIGLYTAVMILVMLWGRRIRGYEDPMKEYGLDLTKPPQIQKFFISLIGGVMIVLSIQSANALLGCVCFCWPSSLPISSLDALTFLRVCGQVIMLAGQGIITATSVVLVEELLFRAWLPEEIASDLGYHRGIIISGLAFSLSQRSLWAIPGLWLFSVAVAGFRQRSQGSLSIPIGLRAGIMASSFILQAGGFLTYKPNYPLWVTGNHPFQPFSGIVGLAFSLILAVILYPRQPLQKRVATE
ncbi:conserved hypothetical protein [Ricinus communis]|uniref:Embryogenesis-associated protein EMB8 n=1 Tax=Ricinus communis TaxID=3988 RepID=B9RR43_RICCO|nr:conserved hypothetical protein [Ricinus communis]